MGQSRGFTDCIMVVVYGCSKVDGGAKLGGVCIYSLQPRVCVCVRVRARAHVHVYAHVYVIMFSSGEPWR